MPRFRPGERLHISGPDSGAQSLCGRPAGQKGRWSMFVSSACVQPAGCDAETGKSPIIIKEEREFPGEKAALFDKSRGCCTILTSVHVLKAWRQSSIRWRCMPKQYVWCASHGSWTLTAAPTELGHRLEGSLSRSARSSSSRDTTNLSAKRWSFAILQRRWEERHLVSVPRSTPRSSVITQVCDDGARANSASRCSGVARISQVV